MPEDGILVTSHSRLLIPSHLSLLSNFKVVVAAPPQFLNGRCPKVGGEQVSRLGFPIIVYLTANGKDPSTSLGMTLPEIPVTSHKPLEVPEVIIVIISSIKKRALWCSFLIENDNTA